MAAMGVERVLFRAAAGPRRGFGHLMRCRVIARVLGCGRDLSLRGSAGTARAARSLGWRVLDDRGTPEQVLRRFAPTLFVIDDPSTRSAIGWVRAAQRLGIPVASAHDLGYGRAGADLTIDGSLQLPRGRKAADLQGPKYSVLTPEIAELRERGLARRSNHVLIALGGGSHVRGIGPALAARIRRDNPNTRIDLAAGLLPHSSARPLPDGCRWLRITNGLGPALATATAAVLAGGVTLYEACALGTPVVTLSVVPAQRVTTRAFAAAGATIDASDANRLRALEKAAAGISQLLASPEQAARQAERARALIDGRGAWRVREHLLRLAANGRGVERRHVA
jgi:spore coat polysaccharide biosynthesis predicted glycosyltransferase SpsG